MSNRQGLQVIPVLDLQAGQVVRAVRGERAAYRPMQSRLAAGSDPLTLARALLAHPRCAGAPPTLYVADLDAILGGAVQLDLLSALLQQLPRLELWLDAGLADAAAAHAVIQALGPAAARLRPVFGSESLRDTAALAGIDSVPGAVLSLDTRLNRALDPAGAWSRPEHWPATLIVMTLDRVGAASGPDLAQLDDLRARRPAATWVGAGGIRSAQDLAEAQAAGASAWLVASALHDGALDPPR